VVEIGNQVLEVTHVTSEAVHAVHDQDITFTHVLQSSFELRAIRIFPASLVDEHLIDIQISHSLCLPSCVLIDA
jgi:hypothetical protein